LIGTEAFLGVRPAEEFLFYVILSPVSSYYAEGSAPIKIWIEKDYLRAARGGLGATKAAANYAASLKAAQEAKDAQAVNNAEGAQVKKMLEEAGVGKRKTPVEKLNEWRRERFEREWGWVFGVLVWFL